MADSSGAPPEEPPVRRLTDPAQNALVLRLAGALATGAGDPPCEAAVEGDDPVRLEAHRCAVSRQRLARALAGGGPPAELSVVWAMYGETNRLQPAGPGNEHGEDLLRAKVDQIRWLVDGLDVAWHLLAVDDGCPAGSAAVARSIAATIDLGPGERISVLELADGLGRAASPEGVALGGLSPAFRRLRHTSESRKGGSILYGLWHAVHLAHRDRHVVAYTDADLSVNLAQLGLLAAPILAGEATVAAGQRYGVDGAVLVKETGPTAEPASTGTKPDKMIILFRNHVRATLLPELADVPDTQAGFKAFDAGAVTPALAAMASFDESFDVELLLRALDPAGPVLSGRAVAGPSGPAVVPILFVEDFGQTNFRSIDPEQRHLDMIIQLLDIEQRVRPPAVGEGDGLRAWLRNLDLHRYVTLIEHLRSADHDRQAAGRPDPLFASRWPLAELRQAAGGGG